MLFDRDRSSNGTRRGRHPWMRLPRKAVEDRGRYHGIAEELAPFSEAAVGSEDHGAALAAGSDVLEEEIGTPGLRGK